MRLPLSNPDSRAWSHPPKAPSFHFYILPCVSVELQPRLDVRYLPRSIMDSPIVSQLFRQLFHHRPAGCMNRVKTPINLSSRGGAFAQQARFYADRRMLISRDRGMKTNESRWQQRSHVLPQDKTEEYAKYPMLSGEDLRRRTERPRRVKMLLRDFIEGNTILLFF